jgi:hypothetical protein
VLDRVSIVGCDFGGGLTLDRVVVKDCRIVQISAGTDVRAGLRLSDGRFENRLFLSTRSQVARTNSISLRGSVLERGASLTIDCDRLDLARCSFGSRSLISGYEDSISKGRWTEVTSMMHATIGDLTLSGMSLRYCRFRDAHGLDTVHFDKRRWSRSFGFARRRVVYEEKLFRHGIPLDALRVFTAPARWPWSMLRPAALGGWSGSHPRDLERPTSARQVQDVYKALERGATHDGNHAIAAEYAWGAYTMRRLSGRVRDTSFKQALRRTLSSDAMDRLLVRVYRVFAGYGLRARWPLAWLVAVWFGFAVTMGAHGFATGSTYCTTHSACWGKSRGDFETDRLGRGFTYSTSTALSLSRPSTSQVTAKGTAAIALARVLTVILIGFAALALRSRVRR